LALDSQGNPRIAYDASYKAYCQYQDPTDPTKPPTNEFREIWHSVRTIFTTQPYEQLAECGRSGAREGYRYDHTRLSAWSLVTEFS
jgi:hypothetical protein